MFFIFCFFLTQRAYSFVRFLIWSRVTPCFYCQSMITKSQFCHGGSVSDVGDLVEVILASVIINFFVILPGFQMSFVITGFVLVGSHCTSVQC